MSQGNDSIDSILQLPQRKLVVAHSDVLLDRPGAKNEIYVLMVEESRGSAGGRAAGSGHRRISKVYGFACADGGGYKKAFETADPAVVDLFDIPYSAVAMDIKLAGGQDYVVQGVVDPDLAASYGQVARSNNLLK